MKETTIINNYATHKAICNPLNENYFLETSEVERFSAIFIENFLFFCSIFILSLSVIS